MGIIVGGVDPEIVAGPVVDKLFNWKAWTGALPDHVKKYAAEVLPSIVAWPLSYEGWKPGDSIIPKWMRWHGLMATELTTVIGMSFLQQRFALEYLITGCCHYVSYCFLQHFGYPTKNLSNFVRQLGIMIALTPLTAIPVGLLLQRGLSSMLFPATLYHLFWGGVTACLMIPAKMLILYQLLKDHKTLLSLTGLGYIAKGGQGAAAAFAAGMYADYGPNAPELEILKTITPLGLDLNALFQPFAKAVGAATSGYLVYAATGEALESNFVKDLTELDDLYAKVKYVYNIPFIGELIDILIPTKPRNVDTLSDLLRGELMLQQETTETVVKTVYKETQGTQEMTTGQSNAWDDDARKTRQLLQKKDVTVAEVSPLLNSILRKMNAVALRYRDDGNGSYNPLSEESVEINNDPEFAAYQVLAKSLANIISNLQPEIINIERPDLPTQAVTLLKQYCKAPDLERLTSTGAYVYQTLTATIPDTGSILNTTKIMYAIALLYTQPSSILSASGLLAVSSALLSLGYNIYTDRTKWDRMYDSLLSLTTSGAQLSAYMAKELPELIRSSLTLNQSVANWPFRSLQSPYTTYLTYAGTPTGALTDAHKLGSDSNAWQQVSVSVMPIVNYDVYWPTKEEEQWPEQFAMHTEIPQALKDYADVAFPGGEYDFAGLIPSILIDYDKTTSFLTLMQQTNPPRRFNITTSDDYGALIWTSNDLSRAVKGSAQVLTRYRTEESAVQRILVGILMDTCRYSKGMPKDVTYKEVNPIVNKGMTVPAADLTSGEFDVKCILPGSLVPVLVCALQGISYIPKMKTLSDLPIELMQSFNQLLVKARKTVLEHSDSVTSPLIWAVLCTCMQVLHITFRILTSIQLQKGYDYAIME